MHHNGRIIEEQKNYYVIETIDGQSYRCTRSGKLKKEARRLCCGDFVDFEITNQDSDDAVIHSARQRTTFISRPPLANIDQVIVVATFTQPSFESETMDRFLVLTTLYNFSPVIVFNKTDLLSADDLRALEPTLAVYRALGLQVLLTSAVSGHHVRELMELCTGKFSCLAGVSGVGKSALLQAIFPALTIRTGELAKATGRGSHTTTSTRCLRLEGGGYIADTPGFAFIDLPELDEADVAACFTEIGSLTGQCRFNNCIHIDEPGCSVKAALQEGLIAESRYLSYVKFFFAVRDRRRQFRQSDKRSGRPAQFN